jgi:hypothetical protein
MITLIELYELMDDWLKDNWGHSLSRPLPVWMMNTATVTYIKMNLSCRCGNPGAPKDVHHPDCVASYPEIEGGRLFGWDIRIDDDMSSGSVAIVGTEG